MNIKVYKCSNEELRNEIRVLSTRALEYMFRNRKKILSKVYITIKIDNEETNREKAYGLCSWTDQMHNPKRFSIILNDRVSKKVFKQTLLHELVHVKQYLLNELKDCYNGNVKWKKKVYEDTQSYYEYIDLPWEKQAFSISEKLYQKLCT
jgi:hypothetical protein